jgi:DnaJ-class molecular chaperone
MSTTSVCDVCKGKGIVPLHTFGPCSYCRGIGYRSWIDYIIRPSKKEKELPCFE